MSQKIWTYVLTTGIHETDSREWTTDHGKRAFHTFRQMDEFVQDFLEQMWHGNMNDGKMPRERWLTQEDGSQCLPFDMDGPGQGTVEARELQLVDAD